LRLQVGEPIGNSAVTGGTGCVVVVVVVVGIVGGVVGDVGIVVRVIVETMNMNIGHILSIVNN